MENKEKNGIVEELVNGQYYRVRTGPGVTDVENLRSSDFTPSSLAAVGNRVVLRYISTPSFGLWKAFEKKNHEILNYLK